MDIQKVIYKLAYSSSNISNKTWNKIKMVFHGGALIHHLFTAVMVQVHTDLEKISKTTLGDLIDFKFVFFTGWNFTIQVIFLMIALYCDYIKMKQQKGEKVNISKGNIEKLASARDFIFTTFVFPFSVFICILFWTTYSIDREMVFPKEWDSVIPSYLNHNIHTNIIAVVVLEAILQIKNVPKSHFKQLVCISTLLLIYFTCFLGVYFVFGRWIYVLFNHLTWPQTVLLLFFVYVSVHVTYFIGWFVNELIKSYGKLVLQKND